MPSINEWGDPVGYDTTTQVATNEWGDPLEVNVAPAEFETEPPADAPFAPTPAVQQPKVERERGFGGWGNLYDEVTKPMFGLKLAAPINPLLSAAARAAQVTEAPEVVRNMAGRYLGAEQGVRDAMAGLASPLGIATLGTAALPNMAARGLSLLFAADMARHVPEAARAAGELSVTGTPEESTRALTGLIGTMGFSGLAGAHAFRPRTPAPQPPPPLPRSAVALLEFTPGAQRAVAERALEKLRERGAIPLPQGGAQPTGRFRETPRQAPVVIGDQPQAQPLALPREFLTTAINQGVARLRFGELQREFSDAIAQGDGPRMVRLQDEMLRLRDQMAPESTVPRGTQGLENLPGEYPPTAAQLGTFRSRGPAVQPVEPIPPRAQPAEVGVVPPETLVGEFPPERPPTVGEPPVPPPVRPTGAELAARHREAMLKMGAPATVGKISFAELATKERPTPEDVLGVWEDFGNKLVENARERMRQGRTNLPGLPFDPELFAGHIIKGAVHIARGVTSFADWSIKMIEKYGDDIRPHLRNLYKASQDHYNEHFAPKTSTPETIETKTPQPTPQAPLQEQPPGTGAPGPAPARSGQVETPADTGGQTPQAPEVLLSDPRRRFSNFGPRSTSKEVFSTPFGFERIPVLGRLFGPRHANMSEQQKALVATAGEIGVGNAKAAAFAQEIANTIDPVFDRDLNNSGMLLNVGITHKNQSLHISDVFEGWKRNPNSYILNDRQRAAFERIDGYIKELEKLEDEAGIYMDSTGEYVGGKRPTGVGRLEAYFPRVIVKSPKPAATRRGTIIAGRQFFQRDRGFATERQGVKDKYVYEPSIEKRLVTRVERAYRAIAEKRLKDDPAMQVTPDEVWQKELEGIYGKEAFEGKEGQERLKKDIKRIQAAEAVEISNALNKAFPNADSLWRQRFTNINNRLKKVKFTADLGVGQIQGLVTMYKDPGVWKKAQVEGIKAMFNKDAFPEYVRNNIGVVREMADLGSSVGSFHDFLAGFESRSQLPVLRQIDIALEPFGRQFQAFLDVAKVELWKSQREITPRNEWHQAMQAIESQLAIARMESIGLNRNRVLFERAALLAPAYYRGALNLVASAGQRGASGQIARRALGAYMVGGIMTFIGVGLALKEAGLSDVDFEGLLERLNPAKGDFMSWDMKLDDQTVRFGLGGIYHSLARLAGNIVKTSIEHPENWKSITSDKNPIARWYRSHAAPLPGVTWDGITGRDFLEADSDVGTIGASLTPLVVQEGLQKAFPREGQKPPTGFEFVTTIFGLRSFPLSTNAERAAAREEVSQKKFGKPYNQLKLRELLTVARETEALPQFQSQASTARSREMAYRSDIERERRVAKGVAVSDELKGMNLRIRGYEPKITINGKTIVLPPEAADAMEMAVIEAYNQLLTRDFMNMLFKLPVYRRQEILDKRLSNAREIAKARILRALK